jgi:hypothetical protein
MELEIENIKRKSERTKEKKSTRPLFLMVKNSGNRKVVGSSPARSYPAPTFKKKKLLRKEGIKVLKRIYKKIREARFHCCCGKTKIDSPHHKMIP